MTVALRRVLVVLLLAWAGPALAEGGTVPALPQPSTALERALAEGRLDEARALLLDAPDTAETDLSRGLLAELEGREAEAARLYRRASGRLPGEAAFRLGNLALRTDRVAEAAQAYQTAVRHHPDHAFAHFNLAVALEALDRPEEALEHADRALALDPAEAWSLVPALTKGRARSLEVSPVNVFRPQVLLLRGRLLAGLERAGAREAWQAAPDDSPTEVLEAWRDLGLWALEKEDLGAGAVWLQAYLESAVQPTGVASDLALWGPGLIRVTLPGGEVRYARSLRLAVDLDGHVRREGGGSLGVPLPPGSHGLRVDRDGTVRVWQEDAALPRAVGHVQVFRVDPSALEPAGDGLFRLKDGSKPLPVAVGPDEDSQVLTGFRHRDAGDSGAWEALAENSPEAARLVRDLPFLDSDQAIPRLVSLVDGPLAPLARARLGVLYFSLFQQRRRPEDLQEARHQWEALRKARPDLEFPALNLASAALMDRSFDDAARLLAEVADANPQRTIPPRLLVSLALARGHLEEAYEAARVFGEKFPHHPFPPFAQAEILGMQDRKAEAVAVLDRLLQANPSLVEARYLLVRLLGRMGNVKRQREELETLLALDPSPYRARRMLGDLLDRLGEIERAVALYRQYLASPEAVVYETEEWVQVEVRVRKLTGGD